MKNIDQYRYGKLTWSWTNVEYPENASTRLEIKFEDGTYYYGLHCGDCLDIWLNYEWIATRVEFADEWYLVGIKQPIEDLIGKDVRVRKYQWML